MPNKLRYSSQGVKVHHGSYYHNANKHWVLDLIGILAIMILVALLFAAIIGDFHIFEDGSWRWFNESGCIPGMLCSL